MGRGDVSWDYRNQVLSRLSLRVRSDCRPGVRRGENRRRHVPSACDKVTTRGLRQQPGCRQSQPSSQQSHSARVVARADILRHASAHKRSPLCHRWAPARITDRPRWVSWWLVDGAARHQGTHRERRTYLISRRTLGASRVTVTFVSRRCSGTCTPLRKGGRARAFPPGWWGTCRCRTFA